MVDVSRFVSIALCLLTLAAPAAGVCSAGADSPDPCAMQSAHETMSCADEIAPSEGCCDPGAVDVRTDLILKRPGEANAYAAAASQVAVPGSSSLATLGPTVQNEAPPPRPAPYRLFSALLL